jgi:hypothetical protein
MAPPVLGDIQVDECSYASQCGVSSYETQPLSMQEQLTYKAHDQHSLSLRRDPFILMHASHVKSAMSGTDVPTILSATIMAILPNPSGFAPAAVTASQAKAKSSLRSRFRRMRTRMSLMLVATVQQTIQRHKTMYLEV